MQQPAGLEEVHILAELGEPGELHTGVGVVVAVLGIDLEVGLLGAQLGVRTAVSCFPRQQASAIKGKRDRGLCIRRRGWFYLAG